MIDIKQKPAITTPPLSLSENTRGVDLSGISEVSFGDVQAVLKRSGAARSVHAQLESHRANTSQISSSDIEGILARAGVEGTDVKTVLAWHVHHHCECFSADALQFMASMDWTDVAAAHIEQLKKQNADQVKGHAAFMADDRKTFEAERADRLKLRSTNDEKAKLQAKTPLQLEADFVEETTNSGLNGKEAFLLLSHRRRFANND